VTMTNRAADRAAAGRGCPSAPLVRARLPPYSRWEHAPIMCPALPFTTATNLLIIRNFSRAQAHYNGQPNGALGAIVNGAGGMTLSPYSIPGEEVPSAARNR
jgi:hypothetical protein